MLRSVFIAFWSLVVTGFFSAAAIVASLLDSSGEGAFRVAHSWARSLLFPTGIKVYVRGLSNIRPGRPYIFMSNHQSNFDIPILIAHLGVSFRWLAKAELFRIPLFGLAIKRSGYISIDRSNRKAAIASLRQAASIIRSGTSVSIFPEGTRSRDGRIHPFKKGGFILAVDAGVPVVPIVIHGTWPIMSKNRLMIRPGPVNVEIFPPVNASDYTRKNKDLLQARIEKTIQEGFQKYERGHPSC